MYVLLCESVGKFTEVAKHRLAGARKVRFEQKHTQGLQNIHVHIMYVYLFI